MSEMRKETDSLGVVEVPADKLWGAQTQRSLEHFSIGHDLIPREMITSYAILKKGAAIANNAGKRLDDHRYKLIVQACDEILAGRHHDMFPLHVLMTGSGTQFNMHVNEVISNRCCQLAGTPLGSHAPVHPNDHVNMAQSSNDSFPSAMYIAAAVNVKQRLIPAVAALRDAIGAKSEAWSDIVKIGRTHMQDATPLTLGQEWSGYAGMLSDDLERIDVALQGVYRLALSRRPPRTKPLPQPVGGYLKGAGQELKEECFSDDSLRRWNLALAAWRKGDYGTAAGRFETLATDVDGRGEELAPERSVERVQSLRPIEANHADAAAGFDGNRLGAHGSPRIVIRSGMLSRRVERGKYV